MAEERSEFRITVGRKTSEGYPLLVAAPYVYGDPTALLDLDTDSSELQDMLARIEQDRASDQFFRHFGSFLFKRLLPGDLATTYELNWKQTAQANDGGLRITLQLLPDELRALPWEALYHPVQGLETWLGTSPRSPLARYVDTVTPPSPKVSLPLRLLVCTAEPKDLPGTGGTVELAEIQAALERLSAEGVVEVCLVRSARRDSLRQAVEDFKPQLFHFIGHGVRQGSVSHLALERGDGTADLVSADLLREVLQRPGTVRGAILNACKSDEVALGLARQGVAAVGMQYEIRSQAAVCLCRNLYQALGSGVAFDAAVNNARFAVRLECGADRRDWCVPVTFLPAGCPRPFEIVRPMRLVQVTSQPPGGHILLDGQDTGRTTPDDIRVQDAAPHRIAVRKDGYEDSLPQTVTGQAGREPQRVEFQLRRQAGTLRIRSNRPGAQVYLLTPDGHRRQALGTIGSRGGLGPVQVSPGTYDLEAVAQAGSQRLVARSEAVAVRAGEAAAVELHLPSAAPAPQPAPAPKPPPKPQKKAEPTPKARPRRAPRALRRKLAAMGGREWAALGVLVAAIVVLAGIVAVTSNSETDGPPPPKDEMIAVPAGTLHKGPWDESVTLRLIREHGMDKLDNLFANAPREVTVASFLIDKYEVTNAQYRPFLEHVRREGDAAVRHPEQPANTDHTPKYWNEPRLNGDDQPVVGVAWFDAWAYARWAKKRLPTEDEWELAARGKTRRLYPWGNQFSQERYGGGEDRAAGPRPVYELTPPRAGAPVGLGGNVQEWTASPHPKSSEARVVRGGAWSLSYGEVYALCFKRVAATPDVRRTHLGFRCVRDIGTGPPPPDMIRIEGGRVQVGGEDTPLLRLMRKHSSHITNVGEVFLGQPPETGAMPAFRVDRCEVSNAEYRRFLDHVTEKGDAAFRHPEQPAGKDHTPAFWDAPEFTQPEQPVVGVDWFDAYAYARWAGKRLPTGDEWERAARGNTQALYPWGDEFDKDRCVCSEAGAEGPQPVNSYPEGASPVGALHMAGNVMEWTAEDYPEPGGEGKALRGGSWNDSCEVYGVTFLRPLGAAPTVRKNVIGFRCAADAAGE